MRLIPIGLVILLSLAVAVAAQRVLPPFERPDAGTSDQTAAEWTQAVTECEANGGGAVIRASRTRGLMAGVVCVPQLLLGNVRGE